MERIGVNRCLWVIGSLLYIVHFAILMSYSLNVPMWDEWELLKADALSRDLSVHWIFEFHNEHRIILTKLLTWILLWVNGWDLNTNVAINFVIYALFVFLLLKALERKFNSELGFVLILMGSSLLWQNHYHPFQNQFHFFLLFFFTAVMLVVRDDSCCWLSAFFAILSAFSFSSGVVCAFVFIVLCLALSFSRPPRFRRIIPAGITALAIGLWFIGFHKNPGHPPLAMPWESAFWNHYLNILSLGLGYDRNINSLPGAILLLLLTALPIWRILTLKELSNEQKGNWLGIIAITCGILGSLASISMARAGFGPEQAKSSRYAEISIILLPMLWVLVQAVLGKAPDKARKIISVGIMLLLVVPFHNHFQWKKVYHREYKDKLETQECIRNYYNGQGDGNCPKTFLDSISDRLDWAKELGISFSYEMNQAKGATAPLKDGYDEDPDVE
jgi:hypothetical protein